jgi:hypothetical protein
MRQGIVELDGSFDSDFAAIPTSECLTLPQDTTPAAPPAPEESDPDGWGR